MSWLPWLTFFQSLCLLIVGVLTAVAVRGFQTGRWSQALDKTKEIDQINARLDRAGQQMSDLADEMQSRDEHFRRIFVDQKVFEVVERELRNLSDGNRLEIERIWTRMRDSARRE